jgi:hypothetical protein
VDLGPHDSLALDALGAQRERTDRQAGQAGLQLGGRDAQIDEGAQGHVAADTTVTIKMEVIGPHIRSFRRRAQAGIVSGTRHAGSWLVDRCLEEGG